MADRPKYVKFISPRLVLQFPKLNKPDTKWKAEGQYTARGAASPDALPKGLTEKLLVLREQFFEWQKGELEDKLKAAKAAKKGADAKKIEAAIAALHQTDRLFMPELDKESGEETGKIIINAKMAATRKDKKTGQIVQQKPEFVDAKGRVITKVPDIWGGTEAKLAIAAAGYYAPNDGAVGVTYYLDAVQILKLVSTGGRGNPGFAEEEGYEATEGGFNDETNGSTSGTEEDKNEDF